MTKRTGPVATCIFVILYLIFISVRLVHLGRRRSCWNSHSPNGHQGALETFALYMLLYIYRLLLLGQFCYMMDRPANRFMAGVFFFHILVLQGKKNSNKNRIWFESCWKLVPDGRDAWAGIRVGRWWAGITVGRTAASYWRCCVLMMKDFENRT